MSYNQDKTTLENKYTIYKELYNSIDSIEKYNEKIKDLEKLSFEYIDTFRELNKKHTGIWYNLRNTDNIYTDDDIDEQMLSLSYKLKLHCLK